MQNMEKALETVELVLIKDKNHIGALDYLGYLYYKLGNLDKSESAFQTILKIDQNNLNALNQLSVCYFDRKKYLIAAALLEKVNELNPKDHTTLYKMARCLYHVDRKVSSLYYLKECITLGQNEEAEELIKKITEELSNK
jgi:tetratricopeptide (TPR) repeat protein